MLQRRTEDNANIRAAYDALAADGRFHAHRARFWAHCLDLPLLVAARLLVREHQGAGALRIVDVGCGLGSDFDLLPGLVRQAGFPGDVLVIGCDLSPRMAQEARRRGFRVLQGDFHDLLDARLEAEGRRPGPGSSRATFMTCSTSCGRPNSCGPT